MKKGYVKFDDINDSLFKSIMFFILGVALTTYPEKLVSFALYALAGFFLLLGLFKLLAYYKNPFNKRDVILGTMYMIFAITIAVFTYFLFEAVQTVMRYTVAVFFLYTGIVRLIASFSKRGRVKLIYLINAFLMISAAVAVALISNIVLRTLGIIIIIYSVVEIATYIFYKKETKDEEIPEGKILLEKEDKEEPKQLKE